MFGTLARGIFRATVRPLRSAMDARAVIWPLVLTAMLNVGCGEQSQPPPSKAAQKQARWDATQAASHATTGDDRKTAPDTPDSAGASAESPASEAWPNWRGPGGSSAVASCDLPKTWPATPPRPAWQTTLGTGWSSPIVAEGRVFLTDRSATVERVLAFDAQTGEPVWERTNPVDFDPHAVGRAHGNGPKATPAWAAGRVYSLGIAGWLQCSKSDDGTSVWSHHLPAEFGRHEPLPSGRATVVGEQHVLVPVAPGEGAPVPLFGYTGSPLVIDDKVILSVGGELGGTIMAFDASTGAVVWQALHENVSYSSPVAAELGGVRQVVVMTGPRVVGLRLSDGELLWSYPFQIQYDESIGTPAIGDDLVLVTGTYRPLTALHIASDGDGQSATLAWENPDLESYLSSMVVHEGHVYGMDDGGRFACVRLGDGVTQWSEGRHGFYCSPVLCGEQFVGLNEKGELSAFEASPRAFVLRARLRLTDTATWTMPAVVGNRIYVRSGDGLACFDFSER